MICLKIKIESNYVIIVAFEEWLPAVRGEPKGFAHYDYYIILTNINYCIILLYFQKLMRRLCKYCSFTFGQVKLSSQSNQNLNVTT